MQIRKTILNLVLDLFIFAIIGFWAYMLYKDFNLLPAGTENMKYTLFNIKLLLFTLFLISSIAVMVYVNLFDKSKSGMVSGGVNMDIRGLEKDLEEIKKMVQVMNDGKKPLTEAKSSPEEQKFPQMIQLLAQKTIDGLNSELLKISMHFSGAERVSLFLYNSEKEKLCLAKESGFKDNVEELQIEEGLAWKVYSSGKRMYTTNVETHPETSRKNKPQYKKRSFMIFPIKIMEDQIIGVMNLTEKNAADGVFSKDDLEVIHQTIQVYQSRLENFILSDSVDTLLKK